MAGKGGARPGAGRKPGLRIHPETHSPIQVAELMLAKNLPALMKLSIEMALDGDRGLLVYCIDRVMGKAVQPISLVDFVRSLAIQEGLTDDEIVAAVAEAERLAKAPSRAG